MNNWSLLSGPVPAVIAAAGAVGLVLLFLRAGRRWWLRAVPTAMVASVVLLAAVVVSVLVLSPFPEPPPTVVWGASGCALLALTLAAAQAVTARWWRRLLCTGAAVLVLAAAANQVNQHFGQYPTVGAVLGAPVPNEVDLAQVALNPASVVRPPHGSVAQVWRPPATLPVAGAVSRVDIPATVSGFGARPGWVYLPPAYLVSPRPQLPVLVLLAGQPGNPQDWLVGGGLQSTMDRYAAAHRGLAPAVVIPDWSGSTLANPMCLDSRLGRSQTYLTVDVPAWIRATLQVDPAPSGWAVAGSSAGGTCALQLALNAPAVYPSFIDISGQSEPTLGDRPRTIAAAFGGDMSAFSAVAPLDLLAHRRYPGSAGFLLVGSGDSVYRPQALQVALAARRAALPITYRELPGSHSWLVWGPGLDVALPWIADRLHLTP